MLSCFCLTSSGKWW